MHCIPTAVRINTFWVLQRIPVVFFAHFAWICSYLLIKSVDFFSDRFDFNIRNWFQYNKSGCVPGKHEYYWLDNEYYECLALLTFKRRLGTSYCLDEGGCFCFQNFLYFLHAFRKQLLADAGRTALGGTTHVSSCPKNGVAIWIQ